MLKILWNTQKTQTKHALRHFKKFLKVRHLAEKSGSRLRCRMMLKIPWNTKKNHLTCFDSQQLTSNGEMSWTTYTVYNFADDLHWPALGILLESIDYHEAARKASFLGSMCEDPLMAAIHFERRFDAWMKYLINSHEHHIGKIKDFFYRIEFKIKNLKLMLLIQTSQTNQMWNYANWSNDSKLIVTVNIFKKHHLHMVVLSFLLFYKPFNS